MTWGDDTGSLPVLPGLSGMPAGRAGWLAFVTCSPLTAPGQLTRAAWQVIEEADIIGYSGAVAEHATAIAAEGVMLAPDSFDTLRGRRRGSLVWMCTPAEADDLAPRESGAMVIVGSQAPLGGGVVELVEVMDRLRSPGGCPWDAEQTHESLAPYAAEEAFELAEAIEGGDRGDIADELGDVLLQVVFHARVAQEHAEPFDIDDVAARIVTKLRRRHPHVFADVHAPSAAHVEANWEAIKAAEKPERTGVLDGIPAGLPPLERTAKVVSRLRRAGRADEVRAAIDDLGAQPGSPQALLATAVTLALAGDDPASALRHELAELERRLT